MKVSHPVLAILLALPAATSAEPEPSWLHFDNGNTLSGHLVGLDDRTVSMESDLFNGPQTFDIRRLKEIRTPAVNAFHLPEGNHIATATLTNGDELSGCLTRVDDAEIGLLTSYASELTLRRDMVDKLHIVDRPEPIYVGPSDFDGWIPSEPGSWVFDTGSLLCKRRSGISRDIGRHPRLRVAFDVTWHQNSQFSLFLHADSADHEKVANGYELTCQSQYVHLRKHSPGDSSAIGSAGGIREFNEEEKIRFEILQDLTTGRVRLLIDGRHITDWQEPAPTPDKMGPYIHFVSEHSTGARISRIMISTWDGLVEDGWKIDQGQPFWGGGIRINPGADEPEEEAEKKEEEEPGIQLRNGDRVEGEILGIEGGVVKLKTPFNEFDLPVGRLSGFQLRTAEEAANPELRWEPIRREGDVRAWFSDGGRVTFQLVGMKDGKLVGRSQTFGEATFDPAVFTRLEFNIYPPHGGNAP